MSCHRYNDAIVDLARGMTIPAHVAQAIHAHIEGCPECAASLRRQRDLTASLAELAVDARGWNPSSDLEQRLVGTFTAVHETVTDHSAAHSSRIVRWSLGIGAAAAFALIVWANLPAPAVTVPEIQPLARAADPPPPKVTEPVAVAARDSVRSPEKSRVARRAERRAATQTVKPVEFMWIPGAARLPTFESGSIVRVELPVSALPAYGVQIVPDAVRSSVAADVLVGQDGQARGIRLVAATDVDSRSRK